MITDCSWPQVGQVVQGCREVLQRDVFQDARKARQPVVGQREGGVALLGEKRGVTFVESSVVRRREPDRHRGQHVPVGAQFSPDHVLGPRVPCVYLDGQSADVSGIIIRQGRRHPEVAVEGTTRAIVVQCVEKALGPAYRTTGPPVPGRSGDVADNHARRRRYGGVSRSQLRNSRAYELPLAQLHRDDVDTADPGVGVLSADRRSVRRPQHDSMTHPTRRFGRSERVGGGVCTLCWSTESAGASPSGEPPPKVASCDAGQLMKMSSGRKADTSMFGASTSWLIFRSTATLQMA